MRIDGYSVDHESCVPCHRGVPVTKLGTAVRNARLSHDLTQDEFARAIGVTKGTIYSVERGFTQTIKEAEVRRALKEKFGVDASAIAAEPPQASPGPIPPDVLDKIREESTRLGITVSEYLTDLMAEAQRQLPKKGENGGQGGHGKTRKGA